MTVVVLSREEVAEALRKEPLRNLRSGQWVSRDGCHVCAVGAVVRSCLDPKVSPADADLTAESAGCGDGSIDFAGYVDRPVGRGPLTKENAMSALSNRFERLTKQDPAAKVTAAIRDALVSFVLRRFPAEVEIDINGFTPARGRRTREES